MTIVSPPRLLPAPAGAFPQTPASPSSGEPDIDRRTPDADVENRNRRGGRPAHDTPIGEPKRTAVPGARDAPSLNSAFVQWSREVTTDIGQNLDATSLAVHKQRLVA
jgi:hypothetical protein